MQEELCHYKIHTLHVIDLSLVIREGNQNASKFLMTSAPNRLHEVMVSGEGATQVSLYLRQRIFICLQKSQVFVGSLHLLIPAFSVQGQ